MLYIYSQYSIDNNLCINLFYLNSSIQWNSFGFINLQKYTKTFYFYFILLLVIDIINCFKLIIMYYITVCLLSPLLCCIIKFYHRYYNGDII